MIKVFTSDLSPKTAGEDLTRQFEEWSALKGINIKSIHTNSNKYGWMLTVWCDNFKLV